MRANPRRLLAALVVALTTIPAASAQAAPPDCPEPANASLAQLLDGASYTIRTTLPGQMPAEGATRNGLVLLADLPDPLDLLSTKVQLDGDLAPELTVKAIKPLNGPLTIRIRKGSGAPATMPVRVELIFDVGTTQKPARIAFGYDAREGEDADAPQVFEGTLFQRLTATTDPAGTVTEIDADLTLTAPPPELALVGEMFVTDATKQERIDAVVAEVGLEPAPSTVHATLDLNCTEGQSEAIDAGLTTDRVLDATISGSQDSTQDDGTVATRTFTGTLTGMPRQVKVHYDRSQSVAGGPSRQFVDYSSPDGAVLAGLDLTIDESVPGAPSRQTRAIVDGVPAAGVELTANRTSDAPKAPVTLDLQTPGGPVASIEGGVATDADVPLVTDPASHFTGVAPTGAPGYANLDGDDIAVKMHKLDRAFVDTGADPPSADRRTIVHPTATAPQPFLVLQKAGTRTVSARILDAPADVTLSLLKEPFDVRYRGSGTIERAELDMSDSSGLFDRDGKAEPTEARVVATDIPRCLRLFLQGQDEVTERAGRILAYTETGAPECVGSSVGTVNLLLTRSLADGTLVQPKPDNSIHSSRDGLVVEDWDDHYVVRARMTALREIDVQTPVQQKGQDPFKPGFGFVRREDSSLIQVKHEQTTQRGFQLRTETGDEHRYADALLRVLPGDVELEMTTAETKPATWPEERRCTGAEFGSGLCEQSTKIEWVADGVIPLSTAGDALVLDANPGDRRPLSVTGVPDITDPQLHLALPKVPATVRLCQATDATCVNKSGRQVRDMSLRIDASSPFELKLFDCRADGVNNVCSTGDRAKSDRQEYTKVDIEHVKFAELEVTRPNKTGGDRGHFYVNTTHTVNGVTVQEALDGDSAPGEDVWMAGIAQYTDGCSDKHTAMQMNLQNVRADDRLVVFEVDNAGCQGTGMDVKAESGTMRCPTPTLFDVVGPNGKMNEELCTSD